MPGIEPGTFGLADECSITELTPLLLIDDNAGEQVDKNPWCTDHQLEIGP